MQNQNTWINWNNEKHQHDKPIMTLVQNARFWEKEQKLMNKCQIWLQVICTSEMTHSNITGFIAEVVTSKSNNKDPQP